VAIKQETIDNTADAAAWTKTVELHMRAKCPHIALMHGAAVRAPKAGSKILHYVVMEQLAGTMKELLLTPGGAHYGADMSLRLHLLANVASGLAYLHSCSVIHGDVKPENVLLSASTYPTAKLADFGSSVLRREGTITRDTLMHERGTLLYMDPCLLDSSASLKAASDVYSFGVMAWQVLIGLQPYGAEMAAAAPLNMVESMKLLTTHVCGPRGKRPSVAALEERGVPPAVVALVEACWAPEQTARPTMAEVHAALKAVVESAPLAYEWDDQLVLRGHDPWVYSLALLPGGRLASGDASGTVRLWNATHGGEATAVLEGNGGGVRALAALPDGCRLAAGVRSGEKVGAVVVWDTSAVPPSRCATVDCGSGVLALAVLGYDRLAAGCNDGGVRLVEVGAGTAGAVTATLAGQEGGVHALAVLPDGTLASGTGDKSVRLWDVGAQTCVATLVGHRGVVRALAVLADGRLASASDDASVRLWDVTARVCVGVLEGHTRSVHALAALPDGRLASGSEDKTIRVWDARLAVAGATGTAAATKGGAARTTLVPAVALEGHTSEVNALQLLPGGRLASGAWDNTVRLWCLPP